jgi:GH25 family lysozyme M1 (1,4-beta-N-acetylmuramidase)
VVCVRGNFQAGGDAVILNKQYLTNNLWFGDNERAHNLREHEKVLLKTRDLRLATLTWAEPSPSHEWGVDVSGRWDGNVDFTVTAAAGASFAIIKCMDGRVPTRLWLENRNRAIAAGLIVGEYGWLYPHKYVDCKAQARDMFERVRTVQKQLPLTIDFEWTKYNGVQANPTYSDLDIWVTEFIRNSGYKPMLYTAAGYCNPLGRMPAELKAKFCALWIANYGVLFPLLPSGWSYWQFHQFAASGEAKRIAPNDTGKLEVDLDYWIDDLESLQRFASVPVTPPGNGEPMTQIIIKGDVLTTLNIRAGAGTEHQVVGSLKAGDKIEATENIYQWLHLSTANGAPVVGQWASAGSQKQYIKWDWFTVDEPPPPPPAFNFPPRFEAQYTDAAGNVIANQFYVPE